MVFCQGFSIGIGDMRITKETAKRVRQECADIDIKAEELRKLHGDESRAKDKSHAQPNP